MTSHLLASQPLRAEVYLNRAPSHRLWNADDRPPHLLGSHEHVVRLTVVGELDLATAPVLRDAVVAAGRAHRVHSAWARDPAAELDVSGLSFLDSSGVTALADAQQTLAAMGCRLCLTRPRPAQLRLLEFAVEAGWLPAEIECVSEQPWPDLTTSLGGQATAPGRGNARRLAHILAARSRASGSVPDPDSPRVARGASADRATSINPVRE